VESVPAKGTVRRTVRMAVALVLSQALLCGLIGWLTFGRSPASGPPPATQAIEPLTLPRLPVIPRPEPRTSTTVPVTTPAPTKATGAPTTAAARRLPPTETGEWPAPSRVPAAPVPAAPAEPPPAPMASTPTAPTESLVPPAPPSASAAPTVQQPVTAGEHCRPEWAFGRTADGTWMRCLRSGPHRLRWKIV